MGVLVGVVIGCWWLYICKGDCRWLLLSVWVFVDVGWRGVGVFWWGAVLQRSYLATDPSRNPSHNV